MDLNATIDLTPETENELTRVVWWGDNNDHIDTETGIFHFDFNRCAVAKDDSNFALISTQDSTKVVLWLRHHPEAKFPDSLTDGEKVLRATIQAHGSALTGAEAIELLNKGGELTYDPSQRVMKWGITLTE